MAKKLTIEEKKKALEEQLKELEVLGEVEEEIKRLIDDYQSQINDELTEIYPDGLESDQSTTWDGQLRWKVPEEIAHIIEPKESGYVRRVYTESVILEHFSSLEEAKAEPYYETKYSRRPISFEDADEWTKKAVRKYRKLIELLSGIDAIG